MDLKKLKFHRAGDSYLLESKQSVTTSFRHYMNLAQLSGFSSLDTKAHPEEYTPLMFANRKDLRNRDIYEDDVIFIELDDIWGKNENVWKLCVVGYNEAAAAFGVYDLHPEYESLTFTAFNQIGSTCNAYRLGNLHIDKEAIDDMLGKIDKGKNPLEVLIYEI